jgi:hypothetical protein
LVADSDDRSSIDSLERRTLRRVNLRVEARKGQQIEVFLKMLLGSKARIYAAISVLTIVISRCIPS